MGRPLDEYARRFAPTSRDLRSSILDCAAGSASFNAEATAEGHRIVSCDPVYRLLSANDIRKRVKGTSGTLIALVRTARERFVWRPIS